MVGDRDKPGAGRKEIGVFSSPAGQNAAASRSGALTYGWLVSDAAARRDDARLRAALEAAAGWYRVRLVVLRPAAVVGLLRDRGLADLAVGTPAGVRWRVGHAPGGVSRTELVAHLRRCGFGAEERVAAGSPSPLGRTAARAAGGGGVGWWTCCGTGWWCPWSTRVGWWGSPRGGCRRRTWRSRSG